jgi:ribosomal protein L11 methyltransferase
MLVLFPDGFEERERGDVLELAGYGDQGDAARLAAALGPVERQVVEPGWDEGWKRFHHPVRIGPLWVGPPWEEPEPGALAVVVDPGRAFGTGAHPTTRLCLELLVALDPASFLDLGCGSGVLAVAAARLGFSPVVAVDADEAALEATRANAAANGVLVDVRRGDVLADALPSAGVAAANIALAAVEAIGARVDAELLIGSGYLAGERPRVRGRRAVERRERAGWAADLLQRFYH